MLIHAGEKVEDGRFTYIGLSGEGYRIDCVFLLLHYDGLFRFDCAHEDAFGFVHPECYLSSSKAYEYGPAGILADNPDRRAQSEAQGRPAARHIRGLLRVF